MCTYLHSEGVETGQHRRKYGTQHNGYDVEEHDGLLEFVDGVLDDHFDEHSKPQGVKLRHIVEKCGEKPHKLAHFRLHRLRRDVVIYLIIGQTKVLDVQLLQECVDLICAL